MKEYNRNTVTYIIFKDGKIETTPVIVEHRNIHNKYFKGYKETAWSKLSKEDTIVTCIDGNVECHYVNNNVTRIRNEYVLVNPGCLGPVYMCRNKEKSTLFIKNIILGRITEIDYKSESCNKIVDFSVHTSPTIVKG